MTKEIEEVIAKIETLVPLEPKVKEHLRVWLDKYICKCGGKCTCAHVEVTSYLNQSPANKDHLKKSIEQFQKGQAEEHVLIDEDVECFNKNKINEGKS